MACSLPPTGFNTMIMNIIIQQHFGEIVFIMVSFFADRYKSSNELVP